jgi:hypothetical protein
MSPPDVAGDAFSQASGTGGKTLNGKRSSDRGAQEICNQTALDVYREHARNHRFKKD